MAATLRDVARLAGVSFKTVSNVVNRYPHVSVETRAKVLAAVEELDYRPNPQARSLRLGRTGMIGLAVPDLGLPYFAELASQVIASAQRHGLTVLTEQTRPTHLSELEVLATPRRRMTDGLIFNPLMLNEGDITALEGAGPLVMLGEALFPTTVDHVVMRNVDASRVATEHLIMLGHRRIAALGADFSRSDGSPAFRFRGYALALESAGIPLDMALVGQTAPWRRGDGFRAMRAVIDTAGVPDAVFAFNDTLALGAIHALQDAGIRVPADVSIVGFDDIEDARFSFPELTTIDPGRSSIAELAVSTLVRRIADPDAPTNRYEPEFSLIERSSTAPRRR